MTHQDAIGSGRKASVKGQKIAGAEGLHGALVMGYPGVSIPVIAIAGEML